VLLLSATAVALWPRTYGTEATFMVDGGAAVSNPVALAGRIEAALLEREELAGAAMDLPPELRSPDPIGRLRAGIRVQSRGGLGFAVEFRGSDPQSVQRIANRLVDRAATLVPKLAAPPEDNALTLALASRTRAVTEFLTAHPEMTLEQASSGGKNGSAGDSGLDALRTEKQQIETRLATTANNDNPYAEPTQDPELLNRRLTELKTTIARREAALKQPRPATSPTVSPELTSQWRTLLADLASAQAQQAASTQLARPRVTAHVTARAGLPSTPLTPNRLVLSIVAALLSIAAAMVAYVLPRRPEPARRPAQRSAPGQRSDPPPAPPPAGDPSRQRSDPPPALAGGPSRSDAQQRSDPPPQQRSDPPPAGGRPGSEPPGPIAVQRTVVLSGPSGSGSSAPPAAEPKRSHTAPGGLQAPAETAVNALAQTALAQPTTVEGQARPSAPLFGSRPPPGAGSYSVSSSHPPPLDHGGPGTRTAVERLSPLQSQRPPAQAAGAGATQATRHSPPPATLDANGQQIMSRPPALDPEAEAWAARFETLPPPDAEQDQEEGAPRKRTGRWKTQVMGSMVPLEVLAAREERPPLSEPDSFRAQQPAQVAQAPTPAASTVIAHDVPSAWHPNVDATALPVVQLRDAVLKQATAARLTIAITGVRGSGRAQLAGGLALALAQSGARVLLVEGDFDTPEVHQALAISAPSGAGFSQQLMARHQDRQARPWVVVRCSGNLQVLAEGRMRSPGLLAADAFERAIQELRDQHHVVVIHAPPLDKSGDLRPIAGLVQAVIVLNPDQSASIQFGENTLRALLQ
jgi:Mrp family chromosome partitioning ATPase